jgi:hypothetical protein
MRLEMLYLRLRASGELVEAELKRFNGNLPEADSLQKIPKFLGPKSNACDP